VCACTSFLERRSGGKARHAPPRRDALARLNTQRASYLSSFLQAVQAIPSEMFPVPLLAETIICDSQMSGFVGTEIISSLPAHPFGATPVDAPQLRLVQQ